MDRIIFTICAKNYIGLSQVLEDSIMKHEKNVSFHIIVADEIDNKEHSIVFPSNVLFAKEILNFSEKDWYDYAFKYDLTEFCTFLKPFCFDYLFKKYGNDVKVVYFDPDIFVFGSLNLIWDALNTKEICITPHVTTCQEVYTGSLSERNLLSSGLYNCGFIAIKNKGIGIDFVGFWEERLKESCYRNEAESMFTDQRWVDFIPSLYPQDSYLILFDLGCNLAPWNYYEREIIKQDGLYKCRNRIKSDGKSYNLTFVHYSGYNYQSLIDDKIDQLNITTLQHPDDLNYIFKEYRDALSKSNFKKYSHLKYSYNYFWDGRPIVSMHRRLYRRLLIDNSPLCHYPFGDGVFYKKCKYKKMLLDSNIDKISKEYSGSIGNSSRIISVINRLFSLLYNVLGVNKYNLLLKLFKVYSKYENNVFLLDKKYCKYMSLMK